MRKNQIVRDDEGNHFRVISVKDYVVRCESVATKEIFQIPMTELIITNLQPR